MKLDKDLLKDRLVALYEMAELVNMPVAQFKRQYETRQDFPGPVVVLRCAPIYDKEEVIEYLEVWGAFKRATLRENKKAEKDLRSLKKILVGELENRQEARFSEMVRHAVDLKDLKHVYEYICGQIEFVYIKF